MKTIIRLSIHKLKHRSTSVYRFLALLWTDSAAFFTARYIFVLNIYYSHSDIFAIKTLVWDPMRYLTITFGREGTHLVLGQYLIALLISVAAILEESTQH